MPFPLGMPSFETLCIYPERTIQQRQDSTVKCALQDALAEAEAFRQEALHREQQLATQIAEAQSEKDKLAKASLASLCIQPLLLWSNMLVRAGIECCKNSHKQSAVLTRVSRPGLEAETG